MRTFLTLFSIALIAAGIQNDDAKSAVAGALILYFLHKKYKVQRLISRK
jgi:hypothetical protein